jgi:SAM-dependent methyltransferase
MEGIEASPEDVGAVYERQAAAYDAARSRSLFEARWLARFAACLKPQGRVLDLGCGSGEPIARWFKAEGFKVTGFDLAGSMLDLARARWPEGDWRQGDMRTLNLDETFDGIIAWDSFFHLAPGAQRDTIARIAAHLAPGGSLLATVGPKAGEAEGRVGEDRIYHASLSPAGYALCLEDNGLRLTGFLAEDPETDGHSVLMARNDEEIS